MNTSFVTDAHQPNRELSQIAVGIGIMLLIAIALGAMKFLQIMNAMAAHASFQMPPEAVTTTVVQEVSWPLQLNAVGTVTAVQGAVLRAQAQGVIDQVMVESGTTVRKGTVILEIDSAVERGNLAALEANFIRAEQAFVRAKSLLSDRATSRSEYETAEATVLSVRGEVAALKAQLAKKVVTAPFDGQLGVRRVNVGQFVNIGDELIPLFENSQFFIDFALPERTALSLKTGLPVIAHFSDLGDTMLRGTVTAIDPQVDIRTRTLHVRAIFDNPGQSIKPGMFARVSVIVDESAHTLAIPTSSINYAPYGDSVFVVSELTRDDGTTYRGARPQTVTLGEMRGNMVQILRGLSAGDTVVTTGVFKLQPGAAVLEVNELSPSENLSPRPMNR